MKVFHFHKNGDFIEQRCFVFFGKLLAVYALDSVRNVGVGFMEPFSDRRECSCPELEKAGDKKLRSANHLASAKQTMYTYYSFQSIELIKTHSTFGTRLRRFQKPFLVVFLGDFRHLEGSFSTTRLEQR